MRLHRFGPFDPASFAAGTLAGGVALLIAAFFSASPGTATVSATLAAAGAGLGVVSAATFTAAVIRTHLTGAGNNDTTEETPR